jgi:hypothetical protein
MKKIIKLHQKTGGTVLLVAHAPSLEVLTRHLMNGQPRPERLAELSGKVDFCSMTIVERESVTRHFRARYFRADTSAPTLPRTTFSRATYQRTTFTRTDKVRVRVQVMIRVRVRAMTLVRVMVCTVTEIKVWVQVRTKIRMKSLGVSVGADVSRAKMSCAELSARKCRRGNVARRTVGESRESSTKPWQFRYSLDEHTNQGVWQQQQQQQLQHSQSVLSLPKTKNTIIPVASTYQPPVNFINYLAKTPTASPQFQFFPQQDAYPPHFVL